MLTAEAQNLYNAPGGSLLADEPQSSLKFLVVRHKENTTHYYSLLISLTLFSSTFSYIHPPGLNYGNSTIVITF